MRGFLYSALALTALDLVLRSPGSAVASAFATPAKWLAEWMSPQTPLIPAKVTTAATTSAPSSPGGAVLVGNAPTTSGHAPIQLV